MRTLIARPRPTSALAAAQAPATGRHPFRDLLPPMTIEPLTEERWTNFTFFCASFVSGFIFFFGMIV